METAICFCILWYHPAYTHSLIFEPIWDSSLLPKQALNFIKSVPWFMVLHAWLRMYCLHSSKLYQIFKAYIRCHIPLWILHWCPAVRCFLPKLNHFVHVKAFKVLSPESSSPVLSFQPYGRFFESRGVVPVVLVPTVVPHAKGCSCWIDKLCKNFNIAYLVASTESRSCLRLVRIN